MPGISFFADRRDASLLIDRLNADPEIAFLVPDGPLDPEEAYVNRLRALMGNRTEGATLYLLGSIHDGYRQRWKAVRTVDSLKDGSHGLWHVPSGSLPLVGPDGSSRAIPDPWAGWTEKRPGADPMKPYFAGNAPEIHLDLSSRHRAYSNEEKVRLRVLNAHWDGGQDILVPSSLEWTVGRGGSPELRRWGNRLKTWFVRSAVGLSDGRQTFWAFPSALAKLKGGMAYYSLGWDLSASIQTAQLQPRSPEARDLVPPREVVIGPDWLQWAGGIVAAIARRIYEERAFHDLPILADALEEAGCTETDILVHLRGPGPHNRSCWALDALLERP